MNFSIYKRPKKLVFLHWQRKLKIFLALKYRNLKIVGEYQESLFFFPKPLKTLCSIKINEKSQKTKQKL